MRLEKKYVTYIILALVVGFLTYILIGFFMDFEKIKSVALHYRYEFFLFAFLCIAANWVNEALMLKLVVSGIKRVPFLSSFKIAMITQFFNLITPFFTGGQPFTVYFFSKEGIEYEESIAAILYKSFTFQIAISCLGTIALVLSWSHLSVYATLVALVSIVINLGIAFLIFFLGKRQGPVDAMVNFFLKLLKKLRLIKHDESLKENIFKRAKDFVVMFEHFGNQRGLFVKLTLLNVLNYSLYIGSAVVILIGAGQVVNLQVLSRTLLLNFSSSVIPTPGTSGGVEGYYFLFLKSLINLNVLTFSVFLWRMASYYLNIFVSGVFVGVSFLKERK